MTAKIRYDYEFLQQFCKENGIHLTKDYSLEKVNRDTIIEAKCLTEGCDDICSKGFRQFALTCSYCERHTKENRKEKVKQTNLKNFGVEYNSQSQEFKDKFKKTCLEKYGVVHPSKSQEIKNKKIETSLTNYGVEYPTQNKEVREKTKKTCLEKYGVEHPLQSEEVKNKSKQTCLEKYGVEYVLQKEEVKEKSNQTCYKKYGCKNVSQVLDFKNKKVETSLTNYGVEYPTQNKEVREKTKKTCLEKYGVECNLQLETCKEKIKQTCLEKYGCENPAQNTEVSEKASKNAYKAYDYIFPSGRVERIQGYENFMLNDLLQKEGILEHDIVVKRSDVPSVWYEDANGMKRRYFVDCFIKSQNRCIEAKSTWTAAKKKDCIYLKQNALKEAGYLCEIWVYDGKGGLVEKIC